MGEGRQGGQQRTHVNWTLSCKMRDEPKIAIAFLDVNFKVHLVCEQAGHSLFEELVLVAFPRIRPKSPTPPRRKVTSTSAPPPPLQPLWDVLGSVFLLLWENDVPGNVRHVFSQIDGFGSIFGLSHTHPAFKGRWPVPIYQKDGILFQGEYLQMLSEPHSTQHVSPFWDQLDLRIHVDL
jgi:hypothetical protein